MINKSIIISLCIIILTGFVSWWFVMDAPLLFVVGAVLGCTFFLGVLCTMSMHRPEKTVLSPEVAEKLTELVKNKVMDAYQIGYDKGSSDITNEIVKVLPSMKESLVILRESVETLRKAKEELVKVEDCFRKSLFDNNENQ